MVPDTADRFYVDSGLLYFHTQATDVDVNGTGAAEVFMKK